MGQHGTFSMALVILLVLIAEMGQHGTFSMALVILLVLIAEDKIGLITTVFYFSGP